MSVAVILLKKILFILMSGFPNILTVHAINAVGLRQTVYTTSITVDTTPPSAGKVCIPRASSSVHIGTAVRVVHIDESWHNGLYFVSLC